jgi:hypothetical protein
MSEKVIAYYNRGCKLLLKREQIFFYKTDEYLLNKINEYKHKYNLSRTGAIKELINIAIDNLERR